MTRKFDKKGALHFKLVQKSVRDQTGNADAAERSFVPMNDVAARKMVEITGQRCPDDEPNIDVENLDMECVLEKHSPTDKEFIGHEPGEAAKYGIYFDDRSYDYTKHLRRIGEAPDAVFIPAADTAMELDQYSSDAEVLAVNHATYDNMQDLDLDPAVREVLEALEDDAFEDDHFDDDFIVKLNRDEAAVLCPVEYGTSSYRERMESGDSEDEDEDEDEDETETLYSSGSSMQGASYAASLAITSIDNKFDTILRMYDEGEDDLDEVTLEEGPDVEEALDEFLIQQNEYIRPTVAERKQGAVMLLDDLRKEMGALRTDILERELDDTDEDVDIEGSTCEDEDHFDCQSIITTYTNTDNHPNVIRESSRKPTSIIRLSRRGMPLEGSPQERNSPTESSPEVAKENKGRARLRTETSEEKKARKAAIKSERRENRIQKKDLKVRFKLGDVEMSRSKS